MAPKCGVCFSFGSSCDEDYFISTNCGHIYHNSCIKSWIDEACVNGESCRCPICRTVIDLGNLVKLHGIYPIQSGIEDNEIKYNIKIILLGDSGVGKSSMLQSFTHGNFKPHCPPTRGMDMGFKTLEFAGKKIKLTVFDSAGQDRFRAICPSFIRNSQGVIITYDISNPESFENVDEWLKVVYEAAPPEVSILLAGNKCDLTDKRQVTTECGQNVARSSGFEFMETSAKDVVNLEAAFRTLLGKIISTMWDEGYIDSFELIPPTIKLCSSETNETSNRRTQSSRCQC